MSQANWAGGIVTPNRRRPGVHAGRRASSGQQAWPRRRPAAFAWRRTLLFSTSTVPSVAWYRPASKAQRPASSSHSSPSRSSFSKARSTVRPGNSVYRLQPLQAAGGGCKQVPVDEGELRAAVADGHPPRSLAARHQHAAVVRLAVTDQARSDWLAEDAANVSRTVSSPAASSRRSAASPAPPRVPPSAPRGRCSAPRAAGSRA